MKVDNITLMMFVLNFVEFCFLNLFTLVIFMKVDNISCSCLCSTLYFITTVFSFAF